jgi:hypothetical protein
MKIFDFKNQNIAKKTAEKAKSTFFSRIKGQKSNIQPHYGIA